VSNNITEVLLKYDRIQTWSLQSQILKRGSMYYGTVWLTITVNIRLEDTKNII